MSPLLFRLLRKAIKVDSGCWEYIGGLNGAGYGNIWDGTTRSAHVVSYELHKGPIPADMNVCHSCDNKRCINPGHLFLGTTQDNIDDMVAKGRDGFRRERNGRALLSEADVVAIREMIRQNKTQQFIADQYNVSRPTISAISTGRNWS